MRLRPFYMRDDIQVQELQPLVDADDKEYLVERVISHTGSNKRDVRFRIHWTGYTDAEDTDEPWRHVEGNTVVKAYIEAHPELLALLEESEAP